MAMTHDYMDYLNDKVGICPAGSQEELQAADVIADLMRQHDVEPNIEEFDAKTLGGTLPSILYVLIFVGIVLGGIGVPVLTALGFVLAVVPAALFVLKYLGRDFISSLGPTTRSQNVVAFHGATGPMVIKGNRPIVVVAHYDSPHVNPLYSTPVARFVPLMWKVSKWCVLGVAVCMLFQVLGFLPSTFRRFLWVVGIIAALPLVVLGVSGVIEHFSDCTDGANDNKSGVAAMLGVLENVRPSGIQSVHGSESVEQAVEAMRRAAEEAEARAAAEADGPAPEISYAGLDDRLGSIEPEEGADSFAAFADESAPAAPAEPEYEEVEEKYFVGPATKLVPGEVQGVRHGADVVRGLGMLPAGCDVEYVEPEPVEVAIPDSEREVATRVVRRPVKHSAAAAGVSAGAAAGAGVTDAAPASAAAAKTEDFGFDFGQTQEPDFAPLPVDAYTEEDDKPSPMDFLRNAADRVSSAVSELGSKISAKREEAREAAAARNAAAEQGTDTELPEPDGAFNWVGEDDGSQDAAPSEAPAPAGDDAPAAADFAAEADFDNGTFDAPAPYAPVESQAPACAPSFDEGACEQVSEQQPAPVPEVPAASDQYPSAPAYQPEPAPDAEAQDAPLAGEGYEDEAFEAPEVPAAGQHEPEPEIAPEPPAPAPVPVAPAPKGGRGLFLRDDVVQAPVYEDLPIAEYEEIPYVPAGEMRKVAGGNLIPFGEEPEQADQPQAAAPMPQADELADEPAEATQATDPVRPVPSTSFNFDGLEDSETLNPDNTGLTAETDIDVDSTSRIPVEPAPKPPAPDDPEWGKTSFRPPANPAARANLFDLPDPSSKGEDPFATDPNAPKISSGMGGAARNTGVLSGLPVISGEDVSGDSVADDFRDADFEEVDGGAPEQESVFGRLKGIFGKKDAGESDHDDAPRHGSWKGGAARRSGLRVVEAGEAAPTEDDLRDEILDLGHDALISHDIWFVALGASDCDHAGMRAFLASHRDQIRGSFVINLDSVAAGDLTLLSHEGLLVTKRADRRMLRMLTTVANDLHVPQERAKYDWASTDATPAMMLSMRGVTMMGTDESGMRALSHTPEDVAENVVPEQAVAAAEIVTELIRRS